MQEQDNIVNSLAHTKWNCKYHIVKIREKVRDTRNTKEIVPMERGGDHSR